MRVPRKDDGDEALARRAAAGDREAFAALYDRYERRAYSLCYRITGSADDAADATQETFAAVLERLPRLEGRELNFGSYLMTAARNASYDAIARRKRVAPAGDIPESAVPVGSGDDPERPERHALRAAHQEQIRAANESLPPRQREVLALREVGELSYDEVAGIMGMNRNSVAQLISRARINLRDSLRQTALGSVAPASPLCERALPLLALRQDQALDDQPSAWLAEHLAGCATCRVRVEAMEEAGVAYRLWLPLVPALWLREQATAHAAERVGADWTAPRASRGARGRQLRLAAAGGGVLAVAFALALVDHAQTPTRSFPASAASADAPIEIPSRPIEDASRPVERRATRRRARPRPVAVEHPPGGEAARDRDAADVSRADTVRVAAAVPDTPAPDETRAERRAPERRRPSPPADTPPAPDPVDRDLLDPDPVDPPPASDVDPTPEPLCPGPNCPGGGSVTTPRCSTAITAATCTPSPPVRPTCERCDVAVPRRQATPEEVITSGPSRP